MDATTIHSRADADNGYHPSGSPQRSPADDASDPHAVACPRSGLAGSIPANDMRGAANADDQNSPSRAVTPPDLAAQRAGQGGAVRSCPYKTSDTTPDDEDRLTLDTTAARLSKCRRSVITHARLTEEQIKADPRHRKFRAWMLMATYRPGVEWKPRHITGLIKNLRTWATRQGAEIAPYVWVAELQQRGAVHYHILIWLPKRLACPKPDKQGWWPHGFTGRAIARNAVGYLAKYASKVESKTGTFPDGCRIHGAGGLTVPYRREKRWWMLPRDVRELTNPVDDMRRMRGGYRTGPSVYPLKHCWSPWRVIDVSRKNVTFAKINGGQWRFSFVHSEHAKPIPPPDPHAPAAH